MNAANPLEPDVHPSAPGFSLVPRDERESASPIRLERCAGERHQARGLAECAGRHGGVMPEVS